MTEQNSNHKGNIAEAAVAFHAAKLGIPVFRPLHEHGRYDLVLEIHSRLLRVQCKWAPRIGNVVVVRLVTNRRGPGGFVRTRYTSEEVDAVVAYCQDEDRCFLLPMSEMSGRSQVHLRLTPPLNGQRAAIRSAASVELGAVAQLEERRYGIPEAGGSSPPSSTSCLASREVTVGAHEFRNHFGWYMERAAAGERFRVTRHGKPYVRLTPANS